MKNSYQICGKYLAYALTVLERAACEVELVGLSKNGAGKSIGERWAAVKSQATVHKVQLATIHLILFRQNSFYWISMTDIFDDVIIKLSTFISPASECAQLPYNMVKWYNLVTVWFEAVAMRKMIYDKSNKSQTWYWMPSPSDFTYQSTSRGFMHFWRLNEIYIYMWELVSEEKRCSHPLMNCLFIAWSSLRLDNLNIIKIFFCAAISMNLLATITDATKPCIPPESTSRSNNGCWNFTLPLLIEKWE